VGKQAAGGSTQCDSGTVLVVPATLFVLKYFKGDKELSEGGLEASLRCQKSFCMLEFDKW